jgi:hypothetical protein
MSTVIDRIEIEWVPCDECGWPICDYGDIKVEVDRNYRPIDVEHECDLR